MQTVIQQPLLLPTLLDRLLAASDSGVDEIQPSQPRELIASIIGDLEDLLNTRQSVWLGHDSSGHACDSLLTYGLPDMASLEVFTAADRLQVARNIEEAIRRFEPRLQFVRVDVLPPAQNSLEVQFHIEAQLREAPDSCFALQSSLDLPRGRLRVQMA